MQSKEELEDWYSEKDRWEYNTTKDDQIRLYEILTALATGKETYARAIDIGCGEGFITQHIPADLIHGLDLSENALNRLPSIVESVKYPHGEYDLVISTGTLYSQYDHDSIYKMIMSCASEFILIGGITDWLIEKDFGTKIYEMSFPYRGFTQKITLYHVETSA